MGYVICIVLILTGCVRNPDGLLQRSSDGSWMSNYNGYADRRVVLENGRYINKAKRNLYESEDLDEYDVQSANKNFYLKMLAQEMSQKKMGKKPSYNFDRYEDCECVNDAPPQCLGKKNNAQTSNPEQDKLKSEIENLKKVLSETTQKITSIKCE